MIRKLERASLEARAAVPVSTHALLDLEHAERLVSRSREEHAALARLERELVERLRTSLQGVGEDVRALVLRELAALRRAREITLFVHPDDARELPSEAALTRALELEGVLSVATDDTLTRGGARLASELGDIDARVETRLDAALSALLPSAAGRT